MLDKPINCILTDPPYGVDYVSRRGQTAEADEMARIIEADKDLDEALNVFVDVIDQLGPALGDEVELYVFSRWDVLATWGFVINEWLTEWGFTHKMTLIWDKGALGMGDIDCSWGPSWEPIIYGKRGRRELNYQRSSVLSFDRPAPKGRIHPTEKPVPLLKELIKISTRPGDVVVDPFAGSGSTLQAAQQLNRRGYGAESDLKRYELARQRLEQQLLF